MARIRHFTTTTRPLEEVRARPGRNSARIPQTAYNRRARSSRWGQDGPEERRRPRGAAVLVPRLHRLPTGVRHQPGHPGPGPLHQGTRRSEGDGRPRRQHDRDDDGRGRRQAHLLPRGSPRARRAGEGSREGGAKATGATGPGGYPVFEDGYYALRDEEGTVHFYGLVHEGEERGSKYAGWPVLRAQASDELHLIRKR